MKSIWICFCNVVCTINRRHNATRHLSSMALKSLLQELNHIFLVSEKSVPSKGSCVGCSTGKFYSWVSKIKCAVHKRTYFRIHKSASIKFHFDEWLKMKKKLYHNSVSKDFAMNLKDNRIPAWTRQYPLLYCYYNPKEFIPSTLLAVLWPQRYEVHTVSPWLEKYFRHTYIAQRFKD